MKLDSICNQVYVVALNEARMQAHEYLTPEHFLSSALMFDLGKEIVMRSGGNVKQIKQDLVKYFDEHMPKKMTENPTDSFLFVRMFEMATAQAHSSERSTISVGNVIACIFNLPECFAAYIMAKNGVDKLKLLQVVSHDTDIKGGQEETEHHNTTQKSGDTEFLKTYTVNLTDKAKAGLLDPLIGRKDIVDRTIQVLSRRLKNNPVHVGDPGVGKTAIVEGLAQKIVSREVPKLLLDSQIFYIDMGTVLAGTRYRGDFEERLIKILDIISKTEKPIIYIDEVHTVVGAGSVSGGGMDATGILKPYLAKGDVRFIGSTTYEEYKKHLEKDRALSRRFQRIDVFEPSLAECVKIIKGIKHKYEQYHNVIYTDEVIKFTCELTERYIRDKHMPDKAIDVIDETGAFVRMNDKKEYTRVILEKDIERTVAQIAKLPEKTVSTGEVEKLKNLEYNIKTQIFGQDEAVDKVVSAIKAARSGINDTERPVASLLFVGATGVGKTEIAKLLALNLGIKLIRFDMSEYQEKHSIARLIGSPPGYVGYEEGGLLTDDIRKTPYCVLLLDEIEKAHHDVYNILLQIMDYGTLTDNTGKKADFRNVILIMTSNAGAKDIGKRIVGFGDKRANASVVDKEVERIFNPEFRNRLDSIVLFAGINEDMGKKIAKKAILELSKRLEDKGVTIKATESAVKYIGAKGSNSDFGAREIIRVVENEIKKQLVDEVLFGKLANGGIATVDIKRDKLEVKFVSKKPKGTADPKSIKQKEASVTD